MAARGLIDTSAEIRTKQYSKCSVTCEKAEFSKLWSSSDGLNYHCKPCVRENSRRWYLNNKKRNKARVDKWREENQERINELARQREKANPEKRKAREERQRKMYPERVAARIKVHNAVREGHLMKSPRCELCGRATPAEFLHGHHEDYSKPLSVIWLCAGCHAKVHHGG